MVTLINLFGDFEDYLRDVDNILCGGHLQEGTSGTGYSCTPTLRRQPLSYLAVTKGMKTDTCCSGSGYLSTAATRRLQCSTGMGSLRVMQVACSSLHLHLQAAQSSGFVPCLRVPSGCRVPSPVSLPPTYYVPFSASLTKVWFAVAEWACYTAVQACHCMSQPCPPVLCSLQRCST